MSLIQPASSSNYPNIFRLFESERSTWHLRDDQSGWNWSCEWQEKSDEPLWRPAPVRRGEEHRLRQTGSHQGNRIQRERERRGYKLSWDKGKCDNCEQFLVSQGEAIWTNCDRRPICSNNGDRGRDSILDLWSTEVGVWHQQEHNMPRGESHSVSRRYLWGRMGWEYAKMFPWLISDHVHCVSSYAQIRIVISKGKKV